MAQDIFKVSFEKFRIICSRMSFSWLKEREREIKEYKLEKGNRLTYDQILHLERMEAIIKKEYAFRMDFNQGDLLQQRAGREKKLNWKRRYF